MKIKNGNIDESILINLFWKYFSDKTSAFQKFIESLQPHVVIEPDRHQRGLAPQLKMKLST